MENRITVVIWAMTIAVIQFSCGRITDENLDRQAKHVIVIGIDGMSPDGILNASTPVLDKLMDEGSYTLNARAVLPTSSSTNWKTMVSGAGPEQHGVTSNGWERDTYILPPASKGDEDIFPTIFGVAHASNPDLKISAIYHWGGFGRLIERSILDYDKNGENEDVTTRLAVNYITSEKPDLLFVHLDHVDHAGHHDGHKTEPYYRSVEKADSLIGEIVEATKKAAIYDETIFIVSADHGGIGYGHGGETLDEVEIPFIISGKNIKKANLIKHNVYQYDNASTVAFVLGIEQPYAWIGKPVKSAFAGFPDPPSFGKQAVKIAAPVIIPKANLYEPAGGLFIDEKAELRIEAAGDVEIRYTLDGREPTKDSKLYAGPEQLSSTTVVLAKSFGKNNEVSETATGYFRVVKSGNNNGVNFKYYEGEGWHFLPVFGTLKPIMQGKRHQIRVGNINNRSNQFAIRYSSYLEIDKDGEYTFFITSDDGSKLYINNELIVDNDGGHGAIQRSGTVELKSGMALLEIEYFNEAGG